MVTTPSSLVKRLTGQEAWTDPAIIPILPPVVSIPAATTTLTLTPAAHSGRLLIVQSTGGLAITPPAATGTGNIYTFVVAASVTGGNFTIDAKAGNASDVFYGNVLMNKVGTGITNFGSASNSNLATFNGTTTGGIKGDIIEMIDIATNVWGFFFSGQGSGTIATPFSNH